MVRLCGAELLRPNRLYRVSDAGWAGYALDSRGDVVLYFKQDKQAGGNGYFLPVTESGTYGFGMAVISHKKPPLNIPYHPGQFNEHTSDWCWFPFQEPEPVKVPEWAQKSEPIPA